MTAVLAVVAPGPWALVLPRLAAAPLWLVAMRRLRPWRPDPAAGRAPLRPFWTYGRAVLGTELARAAQMQGDKLVLGALAGPETLGLWFMAVNAGLGLSNALALGFSRVLFPQFCAEGPASVRAAFRLALLGLAPLIVLQALAVPLYVPVLYGADWAHLAPVISTLCLAAIPGLLWSASANWLRAEGRPEAEFRVTLSLTVGLLTATALLAGAGLQALALGYLLVSALQAVAALQTLPEKPCPVSA